MILMSDFEHTCESDLKLINDNESTGEEMQCSVCSSREAYAILPTCLHMSCRSCVDTLRCNDTYKCRVCHEYSDKVLINPNLVESESVSKSPNCNWCEDNGEHTKSIGHCEECSIWLCGECLKGHNRMPPLRSHNITMLPKSESQGALRCEAHPNEALECFCEACGVLTCRDCQLSVHRDHGSHRWVGEKAVMLKTPLEEAVEELMQLEPKLFSAHEFASKSRTDMNQDSFISSVEKARRDIESRTELLIRTIQTRSNNLLKELDQKTEKSVNQLIATEELIKKIQEQMKFASIFAKQLIQKTSNDPASLVQLFDTIKTRISVLRNRASQILEDSSLTQNIDSQVEDKEFNGWRKSTLGWRSTANTRALFIASWNPEDLSRFSGIVAWLPKNSAHFDLINGNLSNSQNHNGNGDLNDGTKTSETNEFLDNLSEIDSTNWMTENNASEHSTTGIGCAICFGVGLLAHCGQCHRAYHLDCHLPRLTNISLTPGWVCGLCQNELTVSNAGIENINGNGLSHDDYLAGCRILMGLLVHAEAVHFTASVCPACSVPLLTPNSTIPHCPAGHLYHRLAELRLQLEEAASVSNGVTDNTNNDTHKLNVTPKRTRLTCLSDWLVEVDKFWSEAARQTELRGATKGCLRAARRLRSRLNSLVRESLPNYEIPFSTNNNDNSPTADISGLITQSNNVQIDSMDDDCMTNSVPTSNKSTTVDSD